MKILLAIDGSLYSDRAVEEVARRPWPMGSAVKILTVVEPPFQPFSHTWVMPEGYYDDLERAGDDHARSIVEKAAERLRTAETASLEVTTDIVRGYPKEAILATAEQWGADLIVVGSHGYRGLTRLLLGSVAQAVAAHAHCSVEIVRAREAAEGE
ncbi:MAG TPA: universal stress protein [Blastocatellia bacterium]|nr:universal stress protein [Blastocatellia bacterium]